MSIRDLCWCGVAHPARHGCPSRRCSASACASWAMTRPLARCTPGQIIRVVLHWQALRPLATAYTEFLHLGTPANDKVAQTDGWPWDGYFPTAQWAAGEQVLDPRRLRLPANAEPGSYVLRVGWYVNGAHGLTNLTLPNGQQSVALGPFTVAAR